MPGTIDTLTIAQAQEAIRRGRDIEKIFGGASTAPQPETDQHFNVPQIVILDKGFVFVGDVSIGQKWVTIRNAKNIRRWGTSNGLGELAKFGPLATTILDDSGLVRAPLHAMIGLIECEAKSWKK